MLQVVDVCSSKLLHTFTPSCKEYVEELPPGEPPITRMFSSSDGQWLAAINCFGDIYIFNLEIQRCVVYLLVFAVTLVFMLVFAGNSIEFPFQYQRHVTIA